jgi:hypothetical protein
LDVEVWNARERTFLDGYEYSCGKCSIGRMFFIGMGQKRNAPPPPLNNSAKIKEAL